MVLIAPLVFPTPTRVYPGHPNIPQIPVYFLTTSFRVITPSLSR